MRGFASKSEFGAGTIEFGSPFDELCDVPWTFFDEECDGFGIAEAVTGSECVLFVQANFILVA